MTRRNAAEIEAEYQRLKCFAVAFSEFLDARAVADPKPSVVGEPGPDGNMVYREFHGPPSRLGAGLREGLEQLERTKPRGWRSGLRQGVQDLLEMSRDMNQAEVRAADAALLRAGAPTLSTLRLEIWRTIPRILSRGRIRTETEYYLLVERLNHAPDDQLTPQDRDRLASMITDFADRRAKRG